MTPTVVVETNFICRQYDRDVAPPELEAGRWLLDLATAGRVRLAIPAFSLCEAQGTVRGAQERRTRLLEDLAEEEKRIVTYPQADVTPQDLGTFRTAALRHEFAVKGEFDVVIQQLLNSAHVIPLDLPIADAVLSNAIRMRKSTDEIVLHSVLRFLGTLDAEAAPRCLLTYDQKDFGRAEIRAELARYDCEFFASARTMLGRLRLG